MKIKKTVDLMSGNSGKTTNTNWFSLIFGKYK